MGWEVRMGSNALRDSAFVTYSPPGLNSESSGAIYVDPYDRVWYAPIEGGLRWMKGETSGTVTNDLLSQDVIYSIAEARTNCGSAGNREDSRTCASPADRLRPKPIPSEMASRKIVSTPFTKILMERYGPEP